MPPRRLPVLQNTEPDDERPAWHWTFIGVSFVFCAWVPLATLGLLVTKRLLPGDGPAISAALSVAAPAARALLWAALAGVPALSFALACFGAGLLVTRFGAKARLYDAARAGGLSAVVGAILSIGWSVAAAMTALVVLTPIGVAAGWAGGRFGRRLKGRSAP